MTWSLKSFREKGGKVMNRRAPARALAGALVLGFLSLGFANPAVDFPNFTSRYSGSSFGCSVCHTVPPTHNAYGIAYLAAGRSVAALGAIENLDSDADGFRNVDEIRAGSFPGDSASIPSDTEPPVVEDFRIPSDSDSLTVPITVFAVSDNVGIAGYQVTESPNPPAAGDPAWSVALPTRITFAAEGRKTVFAWAKDTAGNISNSRNQNVTITLTSSLPPPSTAFLDVPVTHFAFGHIEAVAAGGIMNGCRADDPATLPNEALFCPDAILDRAQMAVVMETSLGVNPGLLPPCTETMFSDVTIASVGDTVCRLIEDFAARGITGGCQGDDPATPENEARYCPNNPVARIEMAVFLEAALGRIPGALPPFCAGTFADADAAAVGDLLCRIVEDFTLQGITGGCGEGSFCPHVHVTRAQMAVFLSAAPAPLLP